MNNLSTYCGLTDSRMRDSDIDLPVKLVFPHHFQESKILWPTGSNMQLITELEISGVSIQPMITPIAYVIP